MARGDVRFVRFLDLTDRDINCDLQVHTNRTDGGADIEEILSHAITRNLSRIAFTEHVRRETPWFDAFASDVRRRREAYPGVEVLVGCEAKALDTRGSLDATEAILAECEIVLGSVHRFPDGKSGYLDAGSLSPRQLEQIELDLALGLLDVAPIHVLAHPGGMYMRRYADFPAAMLTRLLEKSLERGIAVEINSSYLRDLAPFLDLCAAINPYVSVGSDAHRLDELGTCRDCLRRRGVGRS